MLTRVEGREGEGAGREEWKGVLAAGLRAATPALIPGALLATTSLGKGQGMDAVLR